MTTLSLTLEETLALKKKFEKTTNITVNNAKFSGDGAFREADVTLGGTERGLPLHIFKIEDGLLAKRPSCSSIPQNNYQLESGVDRFEAHYHSRNSFLRVDDLREEKSYVAPVVDITELMSKKYVM